MTVGVLSDIIELTRELTGTGNNAQMTDEKIIKHINSFYLYDFPAEFRSLDLKNNYTFNTVQNVDTYPFDADHNTTVEMPVYVNKRLAQLYTSPWPFYGLFFNWQNREVFDTADGTVGPYSGTVQATPVIRSVNNWPAVTSVTSNTLQFPTGYPPSFNEPNISRVQNILISANTTTGTLHVTDDGNGNLIGDCTTGTIDYTTGVITNLQFTNTIPSGNDINISYNQGSPSIPQAVLFYQNQLTLRPIPDGAYTIELITYRTPSQALLGTGSSTNLTGRPEILEWWETLAYGAAKKIYESRQDMEGVAMMDKGLMERYARNETRTYAQLGKSQTSTIFRGQLSGYGGTGLLGFGGNNG